MAQAHSTPSAFNDLSYSWRMMSPRHKRGMRHLAITVSLMAFVLVALLYSAPSMSVTHPPPKPDTISASAGK